MLFEPVVRPEEALRPDLGRRRRAMRRLAPAAKGLGLTALLCLGTGLASFLSLGQLFDGGASPVLTGQAVPETATVAADAPQRHLAAAGFDWGLLRRQVSLAPAEQSSVMGRALLFDPALSARRDRALHDIPRLAFPKWTGVMEKSYAWDAAFAEACAEIVGRGCGLDGWQDFLEGLRGAEPRAQLERVNRRMNRVRYREDREAWGRSDYWATPGEFFAFGGDCEDYAIAKYYSLRTLGFPPERMRIVVLHDERRRRPHAVLAVTQDGEELLLDNLRGALVTWDQARHYRPFYSVNEEGYRLHRLGGVS